MSKRKSDYQALKKRFYAELKRRGFADIEYGLENPRFIVKSPDPTTPGAQEKALYYERIWQVFHAWKASGRSRRDCRLCELYAAQEGTTGTVRGISRTLKAEKLRPWSTACVQITLKEIRAAAKSAETSNESLPYVSHRHART